MGTHADSETIRVDEFHYESDSGRPFGRPTRGAARIWVGGVKLRLAMPIPDEYPGESGSDSWHRALKELTDAYSSGSLQICEYLNSWHLDYNGKTAELSFCDATSHEDAMSSALTEKVPDFDAAFAYLATVCSVPGKVMV